MKIVPLADVKARLSAYVQQCSTEGPVIITRNGKAVAVLLAPVDEEDLERLMLARSPRFQALLNKSRKSIAAGNGLSNDAFWKKVQARPNGKKAVPRRDRT
jgi:prevent-host-death family protein